jgi:Phospholipase B
MRSRRLRCAADDCGARAVQPTIAERASPPMRFALRAQALNVYTMMKLSPPTKHAVLPAAALSIGLAACVGLSSSDASVSPNSDPRLAHASREDRSGWSVLHLQGSSEDVGYQYGWLAAPEIDDALTMFRQYTPIATGRDWQFFRQTAHDLFWTKLDDSERDEIEGIAAGVRARGKTIDAEDLAAINGWIEIAWYYLPTIESKDNAAPANCSALIATGSYTRDGGIVMAHSAWIDYVIGERWTLALDIRPEHGHRIFMDAFPGFIDSGDDFAVNDAGLMVTETTIAQFKGFDPAGVPEFARARRAMQYASTIDEWVRIMREGNNGGYANSWLIGDRKTGEIARLELGLKNSPLERTRDGYFAGANFPCDAKLCAEETTFDPKASGTSPNARRKRWDELVSAWKGKIDIDSAKLFLADHFDERVGANSPSSATLCGHMELDAKGAPEFECPPFTPIGAVQAKATDSKLAEKMSFWGCVGHACGTDFDARSFLAAHPQFASQAPILRDMPAGQWTLLR